MVGLEFIVEVVYAVELIGTIICGGTDIGAKENASGLAIVMPVVEFTSLSTLEAPMLCC